MSNINERIFRLYDIRGIYDEDLTVKDAELIGKAFGTFIKRKGESEAIVGRDNRKSSPELFNGLVKGLMDTGINVVDIGVVVSPIFYYSTYLYNIKSGIMITASHNPAKYNGFKVQYDGRTLYGDELQYIRKIIIDNDFEIGEGKLTTHSPVSSYIEMIKDKIKLSNRKLKVVVDCGNGTAGFFAPKILKELGCDVIPLYCDSNPDFPNHFPDPVNSDNLKDLIKAVKANNADLGVGFDGDGDRIGVVDNLGNVLWGDMLMILFWREILPKYQGTPAIVEVKCSETLVDEIKRLGGKPMLYNTGHSLIKAKMKELNAVFTGEMSGHMFFADEYFGYDDAIYACARLLRILSNTDKALNELLADIPKTYSTPEIRVECSEDEKLSYVNKAKEYFENLGNEIIDIDGVRVKFEDGWGLVRASNTGPELILRCEAKTYDGLDRIRKEIYNSIYPLKVA
ncbi:MULTISPECIES: phosphomannomutase/phosphoglucomutase [unclassified Clostridium]|uniref:phosphomannomutase/phosphoglucomutase n=1 Tax=unclassified Clostridium TaxID=2614128 RepID=UPI000297A2EA|nr:MULTISPECIES: phosphomannomutase/phosphoglucomutase [unclassified Clostridium]EKQ55432.1 MAG: phosphomannomutase [Clostridium sp. Maddingley MBC34-26]